MSIKEILLLGNPLLRRTSERVRNLRDTEIQRTIEDLRDTLENFRAENRFGGGISAPQIGVLSRIIFTNIDKPMVLINPEIIRISKQVTTLWDDCFSFPDLVIKVKRHAKVSVSYSDELGKRQVLFAVGKFSELLQHEIDHLNGILAVDKAIDSKHIIYRSELEKISKLSHESIILERNAVNDKK